MIDDWSPNALIGTIGEKIFEAKATEVVLEVTAIALAALLKLYAILRCGLSFITGIFSD